MFNLIRYNLLYPVLKSTKFSPWVLQYLFSRFMYYLLSSKFSKYFIKIFCIINNINNEEYSKYIPSSGSENYISFQDFFTRKYKNIIFPLDGVIWPCNGLICDYVKIHDDEMVFIKKNNLSISKIFNIDMHLLNGYYFINVFLHNSDYHWIHAPVNGFINKIDKIPGKLLMLRPWLYPNNPSYPAFYNERVNLIITTERCEIWYLSIVGGLGVGTIIINSDIKIGCYVKIGQEIASFKIGSTCCIATPMPTSAIKGGKVNVGMLYNNEIII